MTGLFDSPLNPFFFFLFVYLFFFFNIYLYIFFTTTLWILYDKTIFVLERLRLDTAEEREPVAGVGAPRPGSLTRSR